MQASPTRPSGCHQICIFFSHKPKWNCYVLVFHGKGALIVTTRCGILHGFALLALCMLPMGNLQADEACPPVPQPIGYVTDYARAISPSDERRLAVVASELERKTGVRVRILTLPYLGGADFEALSKGVLAAWSETPEIGARMILIIDALAEKKMRIEYGPEIGSMLSEEASKRMQTQVMLPFLAQGDRGSAYLFAVTELSVAIGLEQKVALYTVPGYLKLQHASLGPQPTAPKRTNDLLLFIPLLVFMVGMARLETKMARATVVFDSVFRKRWAGRFHNMRWKS